MVDLLIEMGLVLIGRTQESIVKILGERFWMGLIQKDGKIAPRVWIYISLTADVFKNTIQDPFVDTTTTFMV